MIDWNFAWTRIMLWGLAPFAVSHVYAGTLRETGETILPMTASLAGVFTNLCLNYVLIFGKIGFPALGVDGAAIATVAARFVEFAIIVVYVHRHQGRFLFVNGLYRSARIPRRLAVSIVKKGTPLLMNELLWALGMTTMTQIFSTRGLNVIAGLNIASTSMNLFNVVVFSMGMAVAVMVGQALGAGDIPGAKRTTWRLIFLNICICVVFGSALAASAPYIPYIYNTTEEVRMLATRFMTASAVFMLFNAVTHCAYFAIRSGGRTFVTFLFDSVYTWFVFIPYSYVLTHFTSLDISCFTRYVTLQTSSSA